MAQHDYNIANKDGAVVRADLNAALEAIVSNNAGATEPTSTFPFMWWYDTANDVLKMRNAANTDWLELDLTVAAFLKRAMVYRSSNTTITWNVAAQTVNWTTESYDVGAWWALGTPSRLVVPADVSVVQLACNFALTSSALPDASGRIDAQIIQNGASVSPIALAFTTATVEQAAAKTSRGYMTPPLPVSEGDYFELQLAYNNTNGDGTLIATDTWFAIWGCIR